MDFAFEELYLLCNLVSEGKYDYASDDNAEDNFNYERYQEVQALEDRLYEKLMADYSREVFAKMNIVQD